MIGWMSATQPSASPKGSSLVKRSMCVLLWRINTRVFSTQREAQVSTVMISTTGAKREPSGIFCFFQKEPTSLCHRLRRNAICEPKGGCRKGQIQLQY